MAPKKKGGGKKKEAVDPMQAAQEAEGEKMKQELLIEASLLKAQCESEERLMNELMNEREKINYFWIVEKKGLMRSQAELRAKARELQDLEERQGIELKLFKQRVKHLRYLQQDESVNLRIDGELAQKLAEDEHREAARQLHTDKRALKVQLKEEEVSQEEFLRLLKLRQDKQVLGLRQDFERKAKDLQQKFQLRMKTLREEMEKQRKKDISRIEEKKNQHIARVQQQNLASLQGIKHYYTDITSSNIDLIKRLKEDHEELKRGESKDAKLMADLTAKNRALSEPLRKAHQDVERLQEELALYEIDKKKLHNVKDTLGDKEEQIAGIKMQHEILEQQMKKVQAERDELYQKFQNVIYDVQQKSGLQNLLLERKLEALEEAMEIADAQISELLVSANIDKATVGGISEKLDRVIQYKNDSIEELQHEIQKLKDCHRAMVKAYEARLAEFGIDRQNLGFVPQVSSH
ncbi:unnamed protein product [Vitrella brassicaformis CCMP3155]|uniref:Growth arrest-specific protein 8 domain-containing protein n=2 Tax=Vitrella brassicaformis TaxID=1169539 RepID=A0A0G4EK62_VITBC|nr:unnamed protein product [Vitrella brassicaformis CCMP3155]|mmetsp:Transcript_8332/g.20368  ORF Transcript_8332/g.20368 Transcript_8332/m.20368 type:complete len:464 (+) Transcript_8332:67-1458(+)|eukprot:CEL96911.1 unnamed protein product [Vitrella brassicaformis CCMP3155]